ncbi:MAG TPA: CDP-alcohol phosphatidyltransferase family protein [Deltaproteobacteria bacterium]|nr:CDP-alcohol phosphatidyltransferase family protein [Deltaproteobacteria bacterium]
MIKEKLGHRIDGWIRTLFPFLFWRRIDPDWLTVSGMLVASMAGLAFARGEFRLGGLLLVFGGFFDLVDGVVARHFGIATRFGAFLDSSLDRVVDVLVMVGLIVFFSREAAWVDVGLCSVILVASVLTSYARARAELVIDRMPGGLLERGERIGLLAAGTILGVLQPILYVLAIGTTVTVGQRFLYARREMVRLDRESRSGPPPQTSHGHAGPAGPS